MLKWDSIWFYNAAAVYLPYQCSYGDVNMSYCSSLIKVVLEELWTLLLTSSSVTLCYVKLRNIIENVFALSFYFDVYSFIRLFYYLDKNIIQVLNTIDLSLYTKRTVFCSKNDDWGWKSGQNWITKSIFTLQVQWLNQSSKERWREW